MKKLKGIGINSIKNWCNQAQNVTRGSCPTIKDHNLSDKTLKSLYVDDWKKSKTYKVHYSINDLIDHIFNESENILKCSIHEDDYSVYHDELSLMTDNESIE